MLESWKREEARHAFQWGMEHFEDNEVDRHSFQYDPHTSIATSHINGKAVNIFPIGILSLGCSVISVAFYYLCGYFSLLMPYLL
jgi:hypothetical protein